MNNVGFIGAGNMGFAIMKGISSSKLDNVKLFSYDKDNEKLERLEKLGVKALSNEKEIVKECKYVFLAVKPQGLDEVLEAVSDYVTEETVLISICAGIGGGYIKSKTKDFAKVVLVMPNTPLLLGEGASALSKVSPTSDEEFKFVCDVFSLCGEISVLPEDKMKEIIAINGSSPAFIYLYAKAFIDYAKTVGIDEGVAKTLFAKTLIGSAKMITESGFSLEELIEMVSSKGGTTIAGLEKLREGSLEETVNNACEACTKRAYELSK